MEKASQNTYYLKIKSKEETNIELFGSKKSAMNYINEKLKIYPEYKEKEKYRYTYFARITQNIKEGQEWNIKIRDTKITMTKLKLKRGYEEEINKNTYVVYRTERYEDKKTVIKRGITEKEAQKMVKNDIKINPISEKYMIVYSKE